MNIAKLIRISNKLSNQDLRFLIEMNSKRIFVWNPQDKTCYDLDDKKPAQLNGSAVQINLQQEHFRLKPIPTKE